MDKKTIDALDRAGVSFSASLPVPGGGHTISLKADELETFVKDTDAYSAAFFGVSKELYLQWVDSEGTVQCSANTVAGDRCKNMVSGSIHQDIEDWMKMLGGYCAVHGGEGSSRK
ncbi:hypothetical protein ABWH89_09430 [Hoeflea alexandrii]|uniref:hypothetical protein n=1 Tax=Hoeflea alexandrii TaxID=288436 RepID=UPI0035D09CBF